VKFENRTGASAALLKNGSPTSGRHAIGCVVAREFLAIDEAGNATPIESARWPVGSSPVRTPFGESVGDRPFYAGGVDVLLAGNVYAKDGVPEARFDIEIEIGRTFRRRIVVFGDRTWVRRDGQLVPGEPKPFVVARLHPGRSFGGRAAGRNGADVPFSRNPRGRGFHLDAESAEGKPLPNLEHPARLVSVWSDRPLPVGTGIDEMGALDALPAEGVHAVETSGTITVDDLRPTMFNQAHPEMVIEAAKAPLPGDVVRVSRARRGGADLVFRLPDRSLHVFVQLESRGFLVPLVLDQIGIIAGISRVVLGYRTVFEYQVVRGERRFATLHSGPKPATIPAGYRRSPKTEWDETSWWRKEARGQGSPDPSSS
jgi:hypothetical protein